MNERTIPKPIDFDGLAWTFEKCVAHVVDTHPLFNSTRSGARAGDRIVNALAGKSAGDVFTWIDDDAKLADQAFAEPPQGYCPPLVRVDGDQRTPVTVPARAFISFINTVSPE
jgi:hypothetical protein